MGNVRGTVIPVIGGNLGTVLKGLEKRLVKSEIRGRNTKKSPESLRRLIVPQTPVKDHQLMLM